MKAISAGILAVLICHTSERFQLVVFFILKFLEESARNCRKPTVLINRRGEVVNNYHMEIFLLLETVAKYLKNI